MCHYANYLDGISDCSSSQALQKDEAPYFGPQAHFQAYVLQGYGHSIENVGEKPCRVLIGFNTGVYETIDLSQWIAGNPPDLLATNFGKPASLFEKFPKKDVFIADKEGPK